MTSASRATSPSTRPIAPRVASDQHRAECLQLGHDGGQRRAQLVRDVCAARSFAGQRGEEALHDGVERLLELHHLARLRRGGGATARSTSATCAVQRTTAASSPSGARSTRRTASHMATNARATTATILRHRAPMTARCAPVGMPAVTRVLARLAGRAHAPRLAAFVDDARAPGLYRGPEGGARDDPAAADRDVSAFGLCGGDHFAQRLVGGVALDPLALEGVQDIVRPRDGRIGVAPIEGSLRSRRLPRWRRPRAWRPRARGGAWSVALRAFECPCVPNLPHRPQGVANAAFQELAPGPARARTSRLPAARSSASPQTDSRSSSRDTTRPSRHASSATMSNSRAVSGTLTAPTVTTRRSRSMTSDPKVRTDSVQRGPRRPSARTRGRARRRRMVCPGSPPRRHRAPSRDRRRRCAR